MGVATVGGLDQALQAASGLLSAAAAGSGVAMRGTFNVTLWGTFVGTIVLERSFDAGSTWQQVTFSDGTALSYNAPVSVVWSEAEYGVQYRVRCSVYTSGTINWRLSLGSEQPSAASVRLSGAGTLTVGTLPTTLPASPGVLWNNGGMLAVS